MLSAPLDGGASIADTFNIESISNKS